LVLNSFAEQTNVLRWFHLVSLLVQRCDPEDNVTNWLWLVPALGREWPIPNGRGYELVRNSKLLVARSWKVLGLHVRSCDYGHFQRQMSLPYLQCFGICRWKQSAVCWSNWGQRIELTDYPCRLQGSCWLAGARWTSWWKVELIWGSVWLTLGDFRTEVSPFLKGVKVTRFFTFFMDPLNPI
jgi:hypothetical protein